MGENHTYCFDGFLGKGENQWLDYQMEKSLSALIMGISLQKLQVHNLRMESLRWGRWSHLSKTIL